MERIKKYFYNSLTEFYDSVKNEVNSPYYNSHMFCGFSDKWKGLASMNEVMNSKFSYPIGIEKLNQFKDPEVEKNINQKFWNQFDGFDIDVDRMYENLDYLLDNRKIRKLPKNVDIYLNLGEGWKTGYDQMLCKTYAAIKIIDKLETLGVRCAVYACACSMPIMETGYKSQGDIYVEVCIKNHSDSLNIGAVCTAISPWMFRHWMLAHFIGHYPHLDVPAGCTYSRPMPSDLKGIIIETGKCLDLNNANDFITKTKIA